MPRICVFDVMETLLDLRALDPHFERIFGDVSVRQAWFTQLLQTAFVSTITGDYKDFGAIGSAALEMVAARRGMTLSQEDRSSILSAMRQVRRVRRPRAAAWRGTTPGRPDQLDRTGGPGADRSCRARRVL